MDAKLNGYQVRTEKTKAQVLNAAEEVFARDGFEAAQMDSIAKAAGRSKGAIYAHYKSKDDLFLALFEQRARTEAVRLFARMMGAESRREAIETLRQSLIEIATNRTWMLLTIEAKLYALRHPEMRERCLAANKALRYSNRHSDARYDQTVKLIYGEATSTERSDLEARTVAFVPIVTGLVLETEFEPKLLTNKRLNAIVNDIAVILLPS